LPIPFNEVFSVYTHVKPTKTPCLSNRHHVLTSRQVSLPIKKGVRTTTTK